MAKKILAVVVAVMMAVSAMAVTAFADDVIIPLYNSGMNINGNSNQITVTFDIPVWGLYGYLTAGDYFTLDLPTYFGNAVPAGCTINWSLVVDSTAWTLQSQKTTADGAAVKQAKVAISFLGHNWNGTDTAIPQATGYNQTTSFRLVATISGVPLYNGWQTPSVDTGALFTNTNWGATPTYGKEPSLVVAQWYRNGEAIPSNSSYVLQWNPSASTNDTSAAAAYNFVSTEWTTDLDIGNVDTVAANPLTWDHTMENRGAIYSYAGDTVELVVELNKKIVGQAVYTLWAKGVDAAYDYNATYWWQYSNKRNYVDEVTVVGSTDKLVFDVPINFLFDGTYGTYNTEFAILENITLMNFTNMAANDYLHATGSGNYGPFKWDSWNQGGRLQYNGEFVNYARTGKAGANGADVDAKAIYLRLPEIATDEDKTTNTDPAAEGTGNDSDIEGGDEMNVGDTDETPAEGDTTPSEPEQTAPEQNPPTGIALAVIPMILAAAAAVVAKKH